MKVKEKMQEASRWKPRRARDQERGAQKNIIV
jgi:hypothetical protein